MPIHMFLLFVFALLYFLSSQDQGVTSFRCKTNKPLKRVFDAYAENKKVNVDSLRFVYDGDRVQGNQTINDLDKDGDGGDEFQLDVFVEQVGGHENRKCISRRRRSVHNGYPL
mmetsp:Transcript_34056/g.48389  ORF Transcript_34056/g.48389 Transcript_34056/m.48389 type:complete len:113 (-) Transcript_34056:349-687(-)